MFKFLGRMVSCVPPIPGDKILGDGRMRGRSDGEMEAKALKRVLKAFENGLAQAKNRQPPRIFRLRARSFKTRS